MNPQVIDLHSRRAGEARLSRKIGQTGYKVLRLASILLLALAVVLAVSHAHRAGWLIAALAIGCWLPAVWWKNYLSVLPPSGDDFTGRLSADVLARLKPGQPQDPKTLWGALQAHWQAHFVANHLLLSGEEISAQLATDPDETARALQLAGQFADQHNLPVIELGFVVAGLLLASPGIQKLLTDMKAQPSDVEAIANWLGRALEQERAKKPNFGGIGRDWSFGYTPLLNRFGQNLSLGVSKAGLHFGLVNDDGVRAVDAAFNNNAAAIALLGADGIGKTTTIAALAERLIKGQTGPALAYHQVININATDLTSRAPSPEDLDRIMVALANEASRAGHILLFFDNAQQFLGEGHGAFDASQILLSLVESHSVPLILALSPQDFQRLKSRNASLAGQLTPVTLQEPPEAAVMQVLEDKAVALEGRHGILVAYEALHETYRLSGRYDQDAAYPGKAIKLLEQAVNHADNTIVNARSVQQAIEQIYGVKAQSATPAETDVLLHMEDVIHSRMVNQTHAVGVVAGALRRARAGVTNAKRPIGSFLFLGPTGVGKTELARSLAAVYFNSEASMIRLDMSEYQNPSDVDRILATGQSETASLLMSVRSQPFSVVLLDEIEKAHPNVLNLLLQMLDEGQLTDSGGRPASFKDCIIIATSNAGAQSIREKIEQGQSLENFSSQFTDELINSGQFKPELLNRFDEIVLFRPLKPEELAQIVQLMINEINKTLANQNVSIELTPAAIQAVVEKGNDPRLGARPMRRTLQKAVEDVVADKILKGEAGPGDHLTLDAPDLAF